MPLLPSKLTLPSRSRRALWASLSLVVALLSLLLLVVLAQAGRTLPGTTVVGVDVGGRDVASVRRLLLPALEREVLRPLAVSVPGERILVRPVDAGLRLDVDATARAAMANGRGADLRGPLLRLSAWAAPRELAPVGTVEQGMLEAWIEATARRVERAASVGDLRVDAESGEVVVVPPTGAVRIDREASAEALRAALLDPATRQVTLVTEVTAPAAPLAPIEGIAERLREAARRPIGLEHEGRRLSVMPEELLEIAAIIAVPGEGGGIRPALVLPADAVARVLGERGRATFARSARDAVIHTPDVAPAALSALGATEFRPVPADIDVTLGWSSVTFVPRLTGQQIAAMVMEGRRRAEADLIIVDAALPNEVVLARRPTHLIGTFTTSFTAGAVRNVNIGLLARILDDRLVAPGEEFSINATSGPRTCDAGFVPAGTIVRGELVDTCGGGVSQIGTTVMNAAFFAGLPLEQWQPHSFFISRYPAGREATLSSPELDVRFLNDTDGYVVVRASTTPTSVTVSLYGIPAWSSVRADHGPARSPTDFTEVVRIAPDLRPGARRVVQSGGGGFTITVARTRTPVVDGEPDVERFTTVYRPQQRIVEVGRAPEDVSGDAGPADAAPPAADGAGSGG